MRAPLLCLTIFPTRSMFLRFKGGTSNKKQVQAYNQLYASQLTSRLINVRYRKSAQEVR